MDALTLTIDVLFLGLFVGAVVAYLRRRDPLARDVAILFGALAPLLIRQIVENVFGVEVPQPLRGITTAALLAQPVLILRLAAALQPVPRRFLVGAGIAYLVTALPLAAAYGPGPLRIAAAFAFFVTDALAAWYLLAAARRRIGGARSRLMIAAASTVLMASAVLLAASVGLESLIGRIALAAALAAGIGFLIAFLPPAWLRATWQARTAYELSRRLLLRSGATDPAATWRQLAELSASATGVNGAAVVLGRSEGGARTAAATGVLAGSERAWSADEFVSLLHDAQHAHQREARELAPAVRELTERTGARYATALQFESPGGEAGLLILVSRHRSLFARDDRELMEVLCVEAALLAERAAAAAEERSLSERLAITLEELRGASQAKSDFLASMSHELRTPLNAILGFSSLMRGQPGADDQRAVPEEWIDHVHSAGEHLLSLINDVLDLTKVEAGRLELRPEQLDLEEAVAAAVNALQPLAEQKNLRLTTDVPRADLAADPGRFRQILYNLLSNAIKHTPEGGEVRVDVTATDAEVRVAVADTGVGIARADLERIFEEFVQVGDAATRRGGTGLGLALTRRLVQAHGGRIEVDSTVGAGSRFTVVLPRSAELDASAAQTVARPDADAPDDPAFSFGGVLLIEDDPAAVDLVRSSLEPHGFHVTAVAEGAAGIVEARRRHPAVILLDVILPDTDGWDVLRRLKADPELSAIPVVLATVVDDEELGLALGAADYLLKPIEPGALVAALGRYVPLQESRPRRVLVIDDDPAALALVDASLRGAGYELTLAGGGREGIRAAQDGGYDAIVCDLVMPEVDGFEVVAQLKAGPATRNTPILILTGHTLDQADRERLNGKIVAICAKLPEGDGEPVADWLAHIIPPADARAA